MPALFLLLLLGHAAAETEPAHPARAQPYPPHGSWQPRAVPEKASKPGTVDYMAIGAAVSFTPRVALAMIWGNIMMEPERALAWAAIVFRDSPKLAAALVGVALLAKFLNIEQTLKEADAEIRQAREGLAWLGEAVVALNAKMDFHACAPIMTQSRRAGDRAYTVALPGLGHLARDGFAVHCRVSATGGLVWTLVRGTGERATMVSEKRTFAELGLPERAQAVSALAHPPQREEQAEDDCPNAAFEVSC
jgi:hypothetical protein